MYIVLFVSFGLIDGPWCEVNGFGLVYPALEVDDDDPGKVMYGALAEEVLADFNIKIENLIQDLIRESGTGPKRAGLKR